MSKLRLVVRILLGIMLLVFGINKIYPFLPMPTPPEAAGDFMTALYNTCYMLPFIGIVEIIAAILLLANKYVPLALIAILPISVNAFLFHTFLDPAGIGGAILLTIMNIYLMYENRNAYKAILKP